MPPGITEIPRDPPPTPVDLPTGVVPVPPPLFTAVSPGFPALQQSWGISDSKDTSASSSPREGVDLGVDQWVDPNANANAVAVAMPLGGLPPTAPASRWSNFSNGAVYVLGETLNTAAQMAVVYGARELGVWAGDELGDHITHPVGKIAAEYALAAGVVAVATTAGERVVDYGANLYRRGSHYFGFWVPTEPEGYCSGAARSLWTVGAALGGSVLKVNPIAAATAASAVWDGTKTAVMSCANKIKWGEPIERQTTWGMYASRFGLGAISGALGVAAHKPPTNIENLFPPSAPPSSAAPVCTPIQVAADPNGLLRITTPVAAELHLLSANGSVIPCSPIPSMAPPLNVTSLATQQTVCLGTGQPVAGFFLQEGAFNQSYALPRGADGLAPIVAQSSEATVRGTITSYQPTGGACAAMTVSLPPGASLDAVNVSFSGGGDWHLRPINNNMAEVTAHLPAGPLWKNDTIPFNSTAPHQAVQACVKDAGMKATGTVAVAKGGAVSSANFALKPTPGQPQPLGSLAPFCVQLPAPPQSPAPSVAATSKSSASSARYFRWGSDAAMTASAMRRPARESARQLVRQ